MLGYTDGPHGGHAEILYDGVRIPRENLLGEWNGGFAIGQARLGPGRIHHCMRLIGMAERAYDLMCERVQSRVAFGKPIAAQGVVQDWVAQSRIRIEQARLLVLKTAWLMDTVGNRGAAVEISAIKVAVPEMATWVIDRAMQALRRDGGLPGHPPARALRPGPDAAPGRRPGRGARHVPGPPGAAALPSGLTRR